MAMIVGPLLLLLSVVVEVLCFFFYSRGCWFYCDYYGYYRCFRQFATVITVMAMMIDGLVVIIAITVDFRTTVVRE